MRRFLAGAAAAAAVLKSRGFAVAVFSAVAAFSVLSDKIGESIGDAEINTEALKLMVKTAGVSVVTEIASAVCRDASETALAKTAELIGKITIAGMILPVIGEIIKLCVSLCGK